MREEYARVKNYLFAFPKFYKTFDGVIKFKFKNIYLH